MAFYLFASAGGCRLTTQQAAGWAAEVRIAGLGYCGRCISRVVQRVSRLQGTVRLFPAEKQACLVSHHPWIGSNIILVINLPFRPF